MKNHAICALVGFVASASVAAQGQILLDGDMEALTIGTTPDCAAANGAWALPEKYFANKLCEDGTTVAYDVAATSSKVLRLNATSPTMNVHLPNVFSSVINEQPGQMVVVEFDLYVKSGAGAGAIYISGDHVGGGFSNVTDRGPQFLFYATGEFAYAHISSSLPINTILAEYDHDTRLHFRVEIDLIGDKFDVSMGLVGGALVQLGDNLGFRSVTLSKVDRFTWAYFGAGVPMANAELDNVTVTIDGSECLPDCDSNGSLSIDDFICFQTLFSVGDNKANCDGSGSLTIDDYICFQSQFALGC
jgi:hypothetical protein